jgi:hypothetical protein
MDASRREFYGRGSMGFFEWIFGKPNQSKGFHAELPGPVDFEVEVVGTSKYQRAIEKAAGGRTEDGVEVFVQALLVFENDNPHDSNAVQVFVDRKLVGYMKRDDAKSYRKQILKVGRGELVGCCAAKIVGGWDRGPDDRGYFGVRLDLPHT